MLEEARLDASLHDCAGFSCGTPALDEYLRRYAGQHRRRGVSQTYVLYESATPSSILGYYTLSAAQVDVAQISEDERRRLPRFPVPCFRMGRLAASTSHRGMGTGRLLVALAVDRCLEASQNVAAYALLVDAKDEQARAFYIHFGFTPCQDSAFSLYLPLGRERRPERERPRV